MAARDVYHQTVITALQKDGWLITHDPLSVKWGQKDLYIDLGAETLIGAQKGVRHIAIEIKSFLSPSEVEDLKNALGTHILYHDILSVVQPARELFIAIRDDVYYALFAEPIGQILLDNQRIQLVLFDPEQEVIVRWIPEFPTAT